MKDDDFNFKFNLSLFDYLIIKLKYEKSNIIVGTFWGLSAWAP